MRSSHAIMTFMGVVGILAACQENPLVPAAATEVGDPPRASTADTIGIPPQGPYSVLDLGTLGGNSATALAINDSGWTAGASADSAGDTRAFVWRPGGALQDLGTLGGQFSVARRININGDVAGLSTTATGAMHAFLVRHGTMIDLGPALGNTVSQPPVFLNDAATVAWTGPVEGGNHAFVWRKGVVTDLGTLGGPTSGVGGLNQSGEVTGLSTTDSGVQTAFTWNGSTLTPIGDSVGGLAIQSVNGINGRGWVIGETITGGGGPRAQLAWVWDGTGFTVIRPANDSNGFPGDSTTLAVTITDPGEVVGNANEPSPQGVPWEFSHGIFTHLNPALKRGELVTDANNDGVVVGSTPVPVFSTHGIVFDHGNIWDLGSLGSSFGGRSNATAVNAFGDVVGSSVRGNNQDAVVWLRNR